MIVVTWFCRKLVSIALGVVVLNVYMRGMDDARGDERVLDSLVLYTVVMVLAVYDESILAHRLICIIVGYGRCVLRCDMDIASMPVSSCMVDSS